MSEETPDACSLDPAAMRRRLEELDALRADLLGSESRGGREVLRFRSAPGTRERLERLVAEEAECCPFLELELDESGSELVLRIAAR